MRDRDDIVADLETDHELMDLAHDRLEAAEAKVNLEKHEIKRLKGRLDKVYAERDELDENEAMEEAHERTQAAKAEAERTGATVAVALYQGALRAERELCTVLGRKLVY